MPPPVVQTTSLVMSGNGRLIGTTDLLTWRRSGLILLDQVLGSGGSSEGVLLPTFPVTAPALIGSQHSRNKYDSPRDFDALIQRSDRAGLAGV